MPDKVETRKYEQIVHIYHRSGNDSSKVLDILETDDGRLMISLSADQRGQRSRVALMLDYAEVALIKEKLQKWLMK